MTVKTSFLTLITTLSLTLPVLAEPITYYGNKGDYTVDYDAGTYRGCVSNSGCIFLDSNRKVGISTWRNGAYTYSVNNDMVQVYKNGVVIFEDSFIDSTAVNSAPQFPNGSFRDNTWTITIGYDNNTYYYEGYNRSTGDSIYLSGAEVTGNSQRRLYTWRNGNYRYQVAWQPNESSVIRLQVFDGSGKLLLNRLLRQ